MGNWVNEVGVSVNSPLEREAQRATKRIQELEEKVKQLQGSPSAQAQVEQLLRAVEHRGGALELAAARETALQKRVDALLTEAEDLKSQLGGTQAALKRTKKKVAGLTEDLVHYQSTWSGVHGALGGGNEESPAQAARRVAGELVDAQRHAKNLEAQLCEERRKYSGAVSGEQERARRKFAEVRIEQLVADVKKAKDDRDAARSLNDTLRKSLNDFPHRDVWVERVEELKRKLNRAQENAARAQAENSAYIKELNQRDERNVSLQKAVNLTRAQFESAERRARMWEDRVHTAVAQLPLIPGPGTEPQWMKTLGLAVEEASYSGGIPYRGNIGWIARIRVSGLDGTGYNLAVSGPAVLA